MSFAKKVIKPGDIRFLVCKDKNGEDCHFFFQASDIKLKMFKAAELPEIFDLTQYGNLITSGFGKTPSEETRQMLLAEYNYDFNKLQQ